MLHTKCRRNHSTGTCQEEFRRVFTIFRHCVHLARVPRFMSMIMPPSLKKLKRHMACLSVRVSVRPLQI